MLLYIITKLDISDLSENWNMFILGIFLLSDFYTV